MNIADSQVLVHALLENYQNALSLVRDAITRFDKTQWRRGDLDLQVPWKLAYHTVETLDYYFREDVDGAFSWGSRFGGGWWALTAEEFPAQLDLLAYLDEVAERTIVHLSSLSDARLVEPFDRRQEHGQTRLGHYIYALRHTMHHHGEMSLLSLQYGNEEGPWQ